MDMVLNIGIIILATLGIWLFFLGQSVYFIIFSDEIKPAALKGDTDAFERARRHAEEILNEGANLKTTHFGQSLR